MAQINYAKKYLVYLVALPTSMVFNLFGRPAPSWAEDAQNQHQLQLDQPSVFFRPQTQSDQFQFAQPSVMRLNSPDRPIFTNTGQTFSAEAVQRINDNATRITREIDFKIEQGRALTPAEFAALEAVESSIQIDEMRNEISVLTTLIENLKSEIQNLQ